MWLDPAASIVIAVGIAAGTWGLLRESLDLSLDAVPAHIDPREVGRFLASQPEVTGVHDLHIWAMSTREAALTAHLVMARPPASDAFLRGVDRELEARFRIAHATIQCEAGDPEMPCARAGVGAC
jgi:cobalt-zinc-cadmium efflux system protein